MVSVKSRQHYTEEFRADAVKLVLESGYTCAEVGRRLGISSNNVTKWVRLHRREAAGSAGGCVSSRELEADFCVAALNEALQRFPHPLIFNTDQGSQFTSRDFTQALKDADIGISMDGKGRWMDNVMIERLWRSLKYECVYLHAFETGGEVRKGIGDWLGYYNQSRPHSSLDGMTMDEA